MITIVRNNSKQFMNIAFSFNFSFIFYILKFHIRSQSTRILNANKCCVCAVYKSKDCEWLSQSWLNQFNGSNDQHFIRELQHLILFFPSS